MTVRAVGDPLFLKQTYGNGYQVGMLVELAHVEEVKALVTTVLPGSSCSADPATGVLAVGVVKEDVGGLARLFQWLEKSRRAKAAVREWGISNTTLEQVFLMLCVQNTEVNYVDPNRQAQQTQHALCPMCRIRPRAAVIVRVWPPATASASDEHKGDEDDVEVQTSPLIALADSVCTECARGNRHFYIDEQHAREAAADPALLARFVETAQVRAETAKTEEMLASMLQAESESGTVLEEEPEEFTQSADTQPLLMPTAPQQVIVAPPSTVFVASAYNKTLQGTAVAQVGIDTWCVLRAYGVDITDSCLFRCKLCLSRTRPCSPSSAAPTHAGTSSSSASC